jgi:DNA-binding NtrC family response regulator
MRAAGATAFEQMGVKVYTAASGAAALAALDRHDNIAFVLMHPRHVEEIEGCGLVQAMKALRPDLNVILVDGYAADASAQSAEQPSHTEYR